MVPTLAQVTVSVADRTEARIVSDNVGSHEEGATYPVADLGYTQRRFRLDLLYLPSITVLPVEHTPRDVLVLHTFATSASYSWKRTAVSFTQALSFGDQNFAVLATAGGTPTVSTPSTGSSAPNTGGTGGSTPTGPSSGQTGGSTPTTPTGPAGATPVRNLGQDIKLISYTATAAMSEPLSHSTTLGVTAGYSLIGGTDGSRAALPLVQGPIASATVTQRLSLADNVGGTITSQYSWSTLGLRTELTTATANWGHSFDIMTSTQLSAGISGARFSRDDGLIGYSFFPTFTGTLNHVRPLHPGVVSFSMYASAMPVIDFDTLVLDPRIGFGVGSSYVIGHFSSFLTAGSSISTASQSTQGSFTGVSGAAGVAYAFGTAVSASAGVRGAYQHYQTETVLPFTYVGFLSLTIALSQKL